MLVKCIDAGNKHGTGAGLLSYGKLYRVKQSYGGYYVIDCDDGKEYTKAKMRFEVYNVT